ncbi:MAG: hypothetical protein ACT4P7_17730 [Gemmatimonadaceae bacterium]
MKSLLRAFVLPLALIVAVPGDGAAQTKIPPGSYELVPDSNYSAGFDVSGLVLDITETTMSALQAGTVLVKSTLTFSGDVVTLNDTEGQVACPGAAKYKVTITQKGVRLTPVDDPCAERSAVLAQVTLVKKG